MGRSEGAESRTKGDMAGEGTPGTRKLRRDEAKGRRDAIKLIGEHAYQCRSSPALA